MASNKREVTLQMRIGFIHTPMRQDLDALEKAAGTLASRSDEEIEKLRAWFQFYWEVVEHHHIAEDAALFPPLRAKDPEVGRQIEALEADHRELHALVDKVGNGFAAVHGAASTPEREKAAAELHQHIQQFRTFVQDHLRREEDLIFPAIERLLSLREQKEVTNNVHKTTPLKHMSRYIPWTIEAMDPQLLSEVWHDLPFPVRVLYKAFWKKRYAAFSQTLRSVA